MQMRFETAETVFTNARLVLPDEVVAGSVKIAQGKITGIDQGGSQLSSAIDCEGDLVIPGLIELHTDNLERHITPGPRSTGPTLMPFWPMTENWQAPVSQRFLMPCGSVQ